MLRDVSGTPFRMVGVQPTWLTGTVVNSAKAAHDDRLLPERTILGQLAAALAGAGCRDAAVFEHLRGPRPCARGCHVVDALLRRS